MLRLQIVDISSIVYNNVLLIEFQLDYPDASLYVYRLNRLPAVWISKVKGFWHFQLNSSHPASDTTKR